MVLIFDGGNVAAQNKNPLICYQEYTTMRPGLGWMHIKDYARQPGITWTGDRDSSVIDEDKLKNFVPANIGDAGHEHVLRDLKLHLPALTEKMQKHGRAGLLPRSRTAPQRRRAVRRLQRSRRHGRRGAGAVPRAGLRRHRLSSPGLWRHPRSPRLLTQGTLAMPPFDYDDLKDILRCPNSLSPLVHDGDSLVCIDPECRLQYSIMDGIPNMLVDDATPLPVDGWQELMSRHNLPPATEGHLADD